MVVKNTGYVLLHPRQDSSEPSGTEYKELMALVDHLILERLFFQWPLACFIRISIFILKGLDVTYIKVYTNNTNLQLVLVLLSSCALTWEDFGYSKAPRDTR